MNTLGSPELLTRARAVWTQMNTRVHHELTCNDPCDTLGALPGTSRLERGGATRLGPRSGTGSDRRLEH